MAYTRPGLNGPEKGDVQNVLYSGVLHIWISPLFNFDYCQRQGSNAKCAVLWADPNESFG